ncbi:MAG: hypothetical protein P794_00160 [Epsilonproteobacteria bacterium (ex Lamellibrachia satsuma)]|nr:MAG: hypothetical protein P794_00160 [Epsilonproteobacteria bacterium (ex Lamellibrachia satsuma)]
MKIMNIFWIVSACFALSACTQPQYMKQNSAFILFKTPTFKYADMGFIYEAKDEIKVEIYSNAQVLMTLKITESSVCLSLLECMSKEGFNNKILSSLYPREILTNIFRGKAIFNGKNILKKRNGFTQTLVKTDKYNIHYSVLNNQIIFHDTINEILIKVIKS